MICPPSRPGDSFPTAVGLVRFRDANHTDFPVVGQSLQLTAESQHPSWTLSLIFDESGRIVDDDPLGIDWNGLGQFCERISDLSVDEKDLCRVDSKLGKHRRNDMVWIDGLGGADQVDSALWQT